MSMKMWVNRFWLEDLGLDIPTTTEEFYRVLKAFKERDPNGNGKADEIPMSGAIRSWWTLPYDFLMNAFIYNDGGNRLIWENGRAVFAANKEQWREGLRFVKRLFDEGLLDPAAFTQDQEQLKQLGENPDAVILGATGGGYPGNFSERNAPSRREELYTAVPSLLGPSGHRITPFFVQAPGTGQMMISANTPYPEIAFKWGDLRMTYEESLNLNYGKENVNWRWGKPGEKGINGKPAVWAWTNPLQNPQNVTWYLYGPFLYDSDWRLGQATETDVDMYKGENMNLSLYVETAEKYAPYQAETEYTPPMWVTPDVADELAQLSSTIRDYVAESAARFIVGDLDLGADWNSYVREFDKMGLSRFLSIYQTLYDNQYK
jgi:putative aldouronate transport system substrate-binding protein